MSLGDFDYFLFSNSDAPVDKALVWIFFMMGSFLCVVVFMNMLIAIMGNTFANVDEKQLESSLYEQVQLMCDFLWLVNLKKTFHGQKFIFIVKVVEDDEVDDCVSMEECLDLIHRDLNSKLSK